MLNKKYHFQVTLIASLIINIVLILVRIIRVESIEYLFLIWNLFLASIPLFISNKLLLFSKSLDFKAILFLFLWLLFLPNAPYIITDLKHLEYERLIPVWFDLILLVLSAINGLLLGFVSIKQVEIYIQRTKIRRYRFVVLGMIFLLTGYGVYIGRYLRLNSWDILIKPVYSIKSILQSVQINTVCFVLLFSTVIFLFYLLLFKSLPHYSPEVS